MRRIKRSEFFKERFDYWTDSGYSHASYRASLLAERDCQAAEAAGMGWEPEAPELPKRLAVNAGVIYDPDSGETVARIVGDHFEGIRAQKRAIEAVRRYNAWPELRVIADQCTYGITSAQLTRLVAILDGKGDRA